MLSYILPANDITLLGLCSSGCDAFVFLRHYAGCVAQLLPDNRCSATPRSKVATQLEAWRRRVAVGGTMAGCSYALPAFHRFGFHNRCRLPAAAAAAEWKAGWLMTFDPVAYDSTPEPSVALLAEHQLQLLETYLVFTTSTQQLWLQTPLSSASFSQYFLKCFCMRFINLSGPATM